MTTKFDGINGRPCRQQMDSKINQNVIPPNERFCYNGQTFVRISWLKQRLLRLGFTKLRTARTLEIACQTKESRFHVVPQGIRLRCVQNGKDLVEDYISVFQSEPDDDIHPLDYNEAKEAVVVSSDDDEDFYSCSDGDQEQRYDDIFVVPADPS